MYKMLLSRRQDWKSGEKEQGVMEILANGLLHREDLALDTPPAVTRTL